MRTEFFKSDGHQEVVSPAIDRSYIASLSWSTGKHWVILKYPPNEEFDILVSDDLENLKKSVDTLITPTFIVAKSWPDPEPIWYNEARRLMAVGRKIDAIKLTREYTGYGLVAARDFVDHLEVVKICPGVRYCKGRHDTDVSDGQEQEHDSDGTMLCNDCHAYIYYCTWDDHYHHTSTEVAARGCFLIQAEVRAG